MTAHIHRDSIIAHAEDTTRRLEYWSEDEGRWKQAAKNGDPIWFKHARFRVIDHDLIVIAETPAPEPKPTRVRIPACTLPVPLKSTGGSPAWSDSTGDVWTIDNPLKWATEAEAQEWLDFLTADREVVGDE